MREELAELRRFHFLLGRLVVRELKIRYVNSVLGFVWSIIPPLLQVIVFTFLFRSILNSKCPNYSAYALCGLIPWTFLNTSVMDASHSLLENYNIIRKVYLPREIIPLSIVIANFIHFLLAWFLYFATFFLAVRVVGIRLPIKPTILLFPVITFFLACFTTGLALWMTALSMFYDDVKFILQTVFQLAFFVVSVLYPADLFYYSRTAQNHHFLYALYMLNPITAMIDAYRKTLLDPVPRGSFVPNFAPLPMNWALFAGSCGISLLTLAFGYAYFNKRKWQFTERG